MSETTRNLHLLQDQDKHKTIKVDTSPKSVQSFLTRLFAAYYTELRDDAPEEDRKRYEDFIKRTINRPFLYCAKEDTPSPAASYSKRPALTLEITAQQLMVTLDENNKPKDAAFYTSTGVLASKKNGDLVYCKTTNSVTEPMYAPAVRPDVDKDIRPESREFVRERLIETDDFIGNHNLVYIDANTAIYENFDTDELNPEDFDRDVFTDLIYRLQPD